MTNASTSIKKLAALKGGINEYEEPGRKAKEVLHKTGKDFLKALAQDLGLEAGSYDLRTNWAGIAVSGEVTLHADHLYVQLAEFYGSEGGVSVLFRTCRDRVDYHGGQNNTITMKQLNDGRYPGFVAQCKRLMQPAVAA